MLGLCGEEMKAELPKPPFKCPECNRVHEELPDVGYREPYYTHELSGRERTARVQPIGMDLFILDNEHFFVRGVLLLPIKNTSSSLGFGVWSTLSKPNFSRYAEHFDDDLSAWGPMFGYLSNQIPGYPDTLALPLAVQTQGKGLRPKFRLENGQHPLIQDQREGMSVEKWWEIVGPVLHGPTD